LSAASCLDWVANLTGQPDVGTMLDDVETNANSESTVIFLPYLSGERTPHNNPNAKGVFFGMTHMTSKADLALAVLEGVGFAFADGLDALHATDLIPEEISLIGGGARSAYWRQMLADIFAIKLVYRVGGEVGPALGAARLAHLGVSKGENVAEICPIPKLIQVHEPDRNKHTRYVLRRKIYRELYQRVKGLF